LKPKDIAVDKFLKPKQREATDNMLSMPPAREHDDNIFKIPTKSKKDDDEAEQAKPAKAAPAPAPVEDTPSKDLLSAEEFASGDTLGEDLKKLCDERGLLSIRESVRAILAKQSEPDPECGWAAEDKYGAALVALAEEDLLKQLEILFAIQIHCDSIGFPKVDGEYIVQSMFRAMYKYDLAGEDAFEMWKEDEGDNNRVGKLKTIIQTTEWFAWLEEDDDDDDEEEEDEGEEE